MRVVIDMQGAQSESRFRGIGRYSLEFAKSVARLRGTHEVILALNGALPQSISSIREEFTDLLPRESIRVWSSPSAVAFQDPSRSTQRKIATALRDQFFRSLNPDIIHLTSLFEGYLDDAVTDIERTPTDIPVSCHCYDLIPMLNPEIFLSPSPRFREFYEDKLTTLQKASLILTISESAKSEVEKFNASSRVVIPVENVSAGIDVEFFNSAQKDRSASAELAKFRIRSSFLLYVGGADPTKNLDRLVSAYASLPAEYIRTHQLVMAGKMPPASLNHLRNLGKKLGLAEDRLQLLGHVSDADLLGLYRSCRLFVGPSIHEGFGLPPLEAMACGAPVIASNTSSLPEIIGNSDALFDPLDENEIRTKILRVLEDEAFSSSLSERGPPQAQKYSWERVGRAAWQAWNGLQSGKLNEGRYFKPGNQCASPATGAIAALLEGQISSACLAEIASSIAQNDAQGFRRRLFLDISELHRQDAGTGVQRVVRGYLGNLLLDPPKDFVVEPVYATVEEGYRFARRFAHTFAGVGDGSPDDDTFIQWQRGDIFLVLDCQHHVQVSHKNFYRRLQSDGVIVKFIVYDLLPIQYPELFFDPSLSILHEEWLKVVAKSDGAICISQATADALVHWISVQSIEASSYFQVESNHIGSDLEGSQPSVGRPSDAEALLSRISEAPSFLCVSTLEPRKQQAFILEAMELLWGADQSANIVFVGRAGWQTEELSGYIRSHPEINLRLFWLEGISDEFLAEVYQASSCVIAASLNEGFGLSLVEAARFGKPIIARDIPVFRELADGHAEFFDSATPKEFAQVLRRWLAQYAEGAQVKSDGLKVVTWEQSAANLKSMLLSPSSPHKQLMIDVSELVQRDAATGIQRVVKNICGEWLFRPPAGYRVELVYAAHEDGYRYAKTFSCEFSSENLEPACDEYIEFAPGDIFFGLDLQPQIQTQRQSQLLAMQRHGVIVKFMVYDLLPVTMPQFFPNGAEHAMFEWLHVVANSDGAICISEATASDFRVWAQLHRPDRGHLCKIDYAYLGADFAKCPDYRQNRTTKKLTAEQASEDITFLMVGTLEPRKGHASVLDTFEFAWSQGYNIQLLLVGKKGWMSDNLQQRIIGHPELHHRLRWLEAADDTALENAYKSSDCLLVASYGEGFGLPIVEAAARGLPIIARDIPVFREIAGDNAYYFNGSSELGLPQALAQWLELYKTGQHPLPDNIELLKWSQSAANIFSRLVSPKVT